MYGEVIAVVLLILTVATRTRCAQDVENFERAFEC
jgi:hypothetical protein